MKNTLLKIAFVQTLLMSFLVSAHDVVRSTCAHEAFRQAQVNLEEKLFALPLVCADEGHTRPFLHSFCYAPQSGNNPFVYASICSDISANSVWLDADEEYRARIKDVASHIVYCPIAVDRKLFGNDKYMLANGCAELKKLYFLYQALKSNENYSFAMVVPADVHNQTYTSIIIEKLAGEITISSTPGVSDPRVTDFVEMITFNDSAREKIVVQSLQKYYSPVLAQQFQKNFNIESPAHSGWQRMVRKAMDSIKKINSYFLLPA